MFFVVPLRGSWKVPIGYFLCDGTASEEMSNLVSEALLRLQDINVKVVALVCDGPATNFAVAIKLGASLTADSIKPFSSPLCFRRACLCYF